MLTPENTHCRLAASILNVFNELGRGLEVKEARETPPRGKKESPEEQLSMKV
jgi:hypothetical protein